MKTDIIIIKTLKILLRIVMIPLIFLGHSLFAFKAVIINVYLHVKYGSEWIVYSKKYKPDTILDKFINNGIFMEKDMEK